MPKITEAQRENRRQQILDAALRCFSRDGFHNTTTADIVRESGISQGALYLYFANKDDIIDALADDRHQGEAFVNALVLEEQNPMRGLLTLIELHGVGLKDPRRLDARRVGVQGWAEALRNERIRTSVLGGLTSVRKAIIRLIERGQATGQIRAEIKPDAMARTLIAMFQGLVLQFTLGEDVDLQACGEIIHAMIRDALLTPAGRDSFDACLASSPHHPILKESLS